MTPPRGKVEVSLAERGRPALWANEQETAVLSGYSPDAFRSALPGLEKIGFPQINAWNGKRFIPAIVNFWACQADSAVLVSQGENDDPDGPDVENFDESQRRTS